MPYLEFLLGKTDHVNQSRHILLARNGESINKRIVHGIMKNSVQRLRPLIGRRETKLATMSQCRDNK